MIAVTRYLADDSAPPFDFAPVARPESYQGGEGKAIRVASVGSGVLANDSDQDSPCLTAALVSGPSHGRLTLKSNGTFTYIPATGFFGSDSFIYKASDGLAASAPCTVSIEVTGNTPKVQSVAVNDGAGQRSMVTSLRVTFDRAVTIDAGAFLVSRLRDATPIGVNVEVRQQQGRTVARLTFTGADVIGGSLANGNYQLTIFSEKVHRGTTRPRRRSQRRTRRRLHLRPAGARQVLPPLRGRRRGWGR